MQVCRDRHPLAQQGAGASRDNAKVALDVGGTVLEDVVGYVPKVSAKQFWRGHFDVC